MSVSVRTKALLEQVQTDNSTKHMEAGVKNRHTKRSKTRVSGWLNRLNDIDRHSH